jgi:sirohydrochlorin ferrochelatase
MVTAVIILGHGSRREGAGDPLRGLAAAVGQGSGYAAVEHAFIQYATPTLPEAVDRSVLRGAERIVIVPFFVQPGNHVSKDIPDLVGRLQKRYPQVRFAVTDHVGSHPLMSAIVKDLVEKAGEYPSSEA